jgi:hypothetical protein
MMTEPNVVLTDTQVSPDLSTLDFYTYGSKFNAVREFKWSFCNQQ